MKKLRLGIIGIGGMGTGHANSIVEQKVPEIVLTAVADRSKDRRDWARSALPEEVQITHI